MDREEYITDEHLEYLDELRLRGVTNMFGSRPYILEKFPDLTRKEARQVLLYWMATFADRHIGIKI